MRKIFLDCGTHYGQGLSEIANYKCMDSTWEIFSWEANPVTFNTLNKKSFRPDLNVKFFNQAIGINNESITLNIETMDDGNNTGQGSSIVDLDKWNSPLHYGTFKHQILVNSIDFSSFILENFTRDDFIILKIDIEGSEYDVLEKMINDFSIDLISEIYVEWHNRFFSNKEEILIREQTIINELNKRNVKIHDWH